MQSGRVGWGTKKQAIHKKSDHTRARARRFSDERRTDPVRNAKTAPQRTLGTKLAIFLFCVNARGTMYEMACNLDKKHNVWYNYKRNGETQTQGSVRSAELVKTTK